MYCIKRLTNGSGFCCVLATLFAVVLLSYSVSSAQAADSTPKQHKWGLSFGGCVMSGRFTPALLPESEHFSNSMTEMETPYGFGLSMDYKMSPNMRLFVDGNFYTYRKQVGATGEYSTSDWVWEMNDYETRLIGPFDEDAYCYMQTTGFRIGVKYGMDASGFRPWAGAGLGFYSWKYEYVTADRTGTWGDDSGTIAGPTFLFGVDFIMGRESKSPMVITIFGDFLAPVVNPTIENLFNPGWTWEDTGGANIMGAYRFGLSIGFLL